MNASRSPRTAAVSRGRWRAARRAPTIATAIHGQNHSRPNPGLKSSPSAPVGRWPRENAQMVAERERIAEPRVVVRAVDRESDGAAEDRRRGLAHPSRPRQQVRREDRPDQDAGRLRKHAQRAQAGRPPARPLLHGQARGGRDEQREQRLGEERARVDERDRAEPVRHRGRPRSLGRSPEQQAKARDERQRQGRAQRGNGAARTSSRRSAPAGGAMPRGRFPSQQAAPRARTEADTSWNTFGRPPRRSPGQARRSSRNGARSTGPRRAWSCRRSSSSPARGTPCRP